MKESLMFRGLTRAEVFWFFLIASFCFVFPLITAQYLFLDDIGRTLEGQASWTKEGRFLITAFYNFMALDVQVPNVFPLPLIIALVVMSCALRDLVFWCFDRPVLSGCLAVLPMTYTPFFLQNLSYQFDGALMLLGVAGVIYSVVYEHDSRFKMVGVSVGLLVAALGIYQVLINLYVVMCIFELIRSMERKKAASWIVSRLMFRGLCMILGVGVYYLAASGSLSNERSGVLAFDTGLLPEIWVRLAKILIDIKNSFPPAMGWVMCMVLILACIEYLRVGRNYMRGSDDWRMKFVVACAYLLCIPGLLFFVSGIMLFFSIYNSGFRTFIGLSGGLVVVFYLAHRTLIAFRGWSCFVLALPLLYCLSVSYSYGRVLIYQKSLEASVLSGLSYDVQHGELKDMKRLFLIPSKSVETLSAAEGIYNAMPILRSLNIGYVVIAEMLPSVGLNHVQRNKDETVESSIRGGVYPPLLMTRFYSFYKVADEGYILMNDIKRQ